MGGVVLAVLALVGGILGGMALLGGDESPPKAANSTQQQRQTVAQAVTSEPTEAWTWTHPDHEYTQIAVTGDILVAYAYEEQGVTRLSMTGEEMWSHPSAYSVAAIDEGEGLVYVRTAYEDDGLAALDADTGEEVWENNNESFMSLLDGGRVLTVAWDEDDYQDSTSWVRTPSGEELWSYPGFLHVHDGMLFNLDGTTITRFDPVDGEVRWEVDTELELEEDYESATLALNDGIVAASGWDEVVGLDPDSGEELWREGGLWDYSDVEPFGTTRVKVARSGDSEAWEDGEVIFFSSAGETRRKSIDPDDYDIWGAPFTVNGKTYVQITEDEVIYDEDLKAVASFDGTITPVGSGFYQHLNGELSFHDLEDGEKWARQVGDSDDSISVVAAPGLVLVINDSTVTAYK